MAEAANAVLCEYEVSTSDVSRAGRTRYEQRGFSLKGEIGIPLLAPPLFAMDAGFAARWPLALVSCSQSAALTYPATGGVRFALP